jgi:ABC-type sugar transport system permease subunit
VGTPPIKSQIVYEINVDYETTYENLYQNSLLDNVHQTQKGLIWFRFKATQTVFIISPDGKMQVRWSNVAEKKILLKLLRNLLKPHEGQKLRIKPAKQQVWIPYPPPEPLKLYWCDEETRYIRMPKFKRDKPTLFTVFTVVFMCAVGFVILQNVGNVVMPTIANQTHPGTEIIKVMIPMYPYLILAPAIVVVLAYAYSLKFRRGIIRER